MRARRDVEPYHIDNPAFYEVAMRLAHPDREDQIMNVRQLDAITKPGSDHYRYQPLEEVYPASKRDLYHNTARFVEGTRGAIGAHHVPRQELRRAESADPRHRDFRR